MKTNPKKKTVKVQDSTKRKKPVRIDSTIKTKWENPEITHWNKVASKQDSIANERRAKRDSTINANLKKRIKIGNPPKHFLGTAMAGISAGMSIYNTIKANKDAKRAALEAERSALSQRSSQDALELEEYPEEGVGQVNYYQAGGGKLKKGGSFDTIGGKLKRLSSDMELAEGNTHESSKIDNTSGIKLIQGDKAVAEIEDDETVKDGNLVYSDRLKSVNGKTFADNAKVLARKKAKAESRVNVGDSISKNTASRKVQILDQEENALFMEQEQQKQKKGIKPNTKVPKAGFGALIEATGMDTSGGSKGGGKSFGSILSKGTPYVDNIVNAGLSLFGTPKVAKPSYVKARKLNTNVNVNPQLNAVDDAVNGSTRTIMDNTSNSNTARNNVASVRLKGARAKGDILARKENEENRLKDRNSEFQMRTDMVNAQKRDGFNQQNMARQGQIKSDISANVSNLAGDFVDIENRKRDEQYNAETLAAIKTAYGKNGIVDRSDSTMLEEIRKITERLKERKFGGKVMAKGGKITDPQKKKISLKQKVKL